MKISHFFYFYKFNINKKEAIVFVFLLPNLKIEKPNLAKQN